VVVNGREAYGDVVELCETSTGPTDSTERETLIKNESIFIFKLQFDLSNESARHPESAHPF
jgi:hypothetical protein